MDLKLVILILFSLGVALVGCVEEDACKPRNIAFCLDEHRMWSCVPDGNPEKGSPLYIIEVLDCRTLGTGSNPYCVTSLSEDEMRGSTQCRTKPKRSSGNEDAGNDVDADAN